MAARSGLQWVEYTWARPISTGKIEVYWFDDQRGVRLPKACRLKYWDGAAWSDVKNVQGLGLVANRFNATTFDPVTTTRLRLEMDSNEKFSTGILEWRVLDDGRSPNFAPTVSAGVDRAVVLGGKTYLTGTVHDDGKPRATPKIGWCKLSGPGEVAFADSAAMETTAQFTVPGQYVLRLSANDGQFEGTSDVHVAVEPPPPAGHLQPVWTTQYSISSPFWRPRVKNLIVHWIPHCAAKIDDPQLPEGGLENFVQAAEKLAGRPAKHTGAPFANAWVYNTLESMCLAQLVDAEGDAEILAAQAAMRKTVDRWIPVLLSAQEPDGYLQTMYTIRGHRRWSNKGDHEGYNAGYFIEAAMAHWQASGGKDRRMLDAAIRMADCWCANIGPTPKRFWYEGHQEIEQALVRLARFVEAIDGPGKGAKYLELARFLCDCRGKGDEYDQSHLPVTRQYEAVGHAVRAVYSYSGMADVAMETGDVDYHSAVRSIWHNLVDRKYYVTGGVGSGETSEGFGKDYSLPVHAYCESCAGCGELFFQTKMLWIYRDALCADLLEETLYNAVLGSVDLPAENFTYTNSLDSNEKRYKWHGCPCCVGNIPRTILQIPTWMYAKDANGLYVNLFAGSSVSLGDVAGGPVRMVQTTDYPWSGKVTIAVHPDRQRRFAVRVRVPGRQTSPLYTPSPSCEGLLSLTINGEAAAPRMERGYAVLDRIWKPGDRIELTLPMIVQRVRPSDKIAATVGRVALRYGPLIYNIESVDQSVESTLAADSPLALAWQPELLGGVMAIRGTFADGKPLLAVPNYARLNRGGRSVVWIKEKP